MTNEKRENMLVANLSEERWCVNFSIEEDIQTKVVLFLRDTLSVLGLVNDVVIVNESQSRDGKKANIWIVKTGSGQPLAVCEVKCPTTFKDPETNSAQSVLLHPGVMGQLFDYMVELRTMFGQCEVYGILTNLKEWTLCWFPDTDRSAVAFDTSVRYDYSLESQFLLKSQIIQKRILHRSKLYQLVDEDLPVSLLSVLSKSYHAHFRSIPLLSSDRVYLTYTDKTFLWESLSDEDMQTDLLLTLPPRQTKAYKVLRFFHGGATGRVMLAITKRFHLVVIKVHENQADAEQETSAWTSLYHEGVFTTTLRVDVKALPVVDMPMVFHVTTNLQEKTVALQTDLASWSKEKASLSDSTQMFDTWTAKLKEAWERTEGTIPSIANEAIRELASNNFFHNDLKWEHFAVMPVLDESGMEIERLKPILIDLASLEHQPDSEIAYQKMKSELDAMCEEFGLELEPDL